MIVLAIIETSFTDWFFDFLHYSICSNITEKGIIFKIMAVEKACSELIICEIEELAKPESYIVCRDLSLQHSP